MTAADCSGCAAHGVAGLQRLGRGTTADRLVALAGNPNTGKSTLFNTLSGLRQRVGNWSGTTVAYAEGGFRFGEHAYRVVDLPGAYSLAPAATEEAETLEFLRSAEPDAIVVVVDATRLERTLPMAIQVAARSGRVVVAVNLVDEARAAGLELDLRHLARALGVPVLPLVARSGEGLSDLLAAVDEVAGRPDRRRRSGGRSIDEDAIAATYEVAHRLAAATVSSSDRPAASGSWGQRLDRVLTHRVWGFLVMGLLLYGVFWLTISGAAGPSDALFWLLVDHGHPAVVAGLTHVGAPAWLVGILGDGAYLATAWVIAVMLPPMAIFFPLFALLEDFGYLPRVAFNLDRLFARSGAHGKQALTLMMGFGCNAAGVTATRIIDSPRERLIAIITNNFSVCNGRWPTLILISTIFLGTLGPPSIAGTVAAAGVVLVALIGVVVTLVVSWGLTHTVLRGEASFYALELPAYRRPQVWRTVWTTTADRTLKVLWRAVVMAAPAGVVIWLMTHVVVADETLATRTVALLDPPGVLLGLNGVVLLAYVLAIPANEIVIPTILLLTVHVSSAGSSVLADASGQQAASVLVGVGGWTLLTGVNLMLFSLLHNPCSTTMLTIWKETRSVRWTTVATLLPLAVAVAVTGVVATLARSLGFAG